MRERVTVIDSDFGVERPLNVFFADGAPASAREGLKDVPGISVTVNDKTSGPELVDILRRTGAEAVDVLVVRSATKLTGELGESLFRQSKLDLVVRAGIGVDNIHTEAAADNGIVVENTPRGNVDAVAVKTLRDMEHVESMQFRGTVALREGDGSKVKWTEGADVFKGRTFGVVGLGNIGKRVAQEILNRRGSVIGFDPYAQMDGIENVTLDDLCRRADVITVHAPLTDSTKNLIGELQFRLMKDGVVLINNARGGIVNEEALLAALNAKKVRAAVLDVFTVEKEPLAGREEAIGGLSPDKANYVRDVLRPLVKHPRVVSTMHSAANSSEAQTANGRDVAMQVRTFADGRGIVNGANFPSVSIRNGSGIAGTSYRVQVLNRNVPGVNASVDRAALEVHGGYNVERVSGDNLPNGLAARVAEVTFRTQSDGARVEAVSIDTAQRILEAMRAVEGVLGVRMVRVDRQK